MSLSSIAGLIFHFYSLLIFLRILLSWIPNINWHEQPVKWIREVTDAYLNLFRNVVPPIGMLDISPMLALFVLWLLQGLVVGALASMGL